MSGDLDIICILNALGENEIGSKRWRLLINELKKLPPIIKVFTKTSQISCDVVIVENDHPRFIEYHENQYYRLSDDRSRYIYDIDGNSIAVSRFVQRFLKDVWRLQNLYPFLIVWDDKFKKDGLTKFAFNNCSVYEYYLEGQNNFSRFTQQRVS